MVPRNPLQVGSEAECVSSSRVSEVCFGGAERDDTLCLLTISEPPISGSPVEAALASFLTSQEAVCRCIGGFKHEMRF